MMFYTAEEKQKLFFKFLRKHGLPNYTSDKCYTEYVMRDLTQDDVQEIYDAGWRDSDLLQTRLETQRAMKKKAKNDLAKARKNGLT